MTTATPTNTPLNIGIDEKQREVISNDMCRLLATTYSLYLKTHNFHWNVTGPMFQSLHIMLEQHYMELALAVDEVAERIRALGFKAPGSYAEYAELTEIKDETGWPDADLMIQQLVDGHETIARLCRSALANAQGADDEVTAGLLADRMTVHEKTAWMLRSLIANK